MQRLRIIKMGLIGIYAIHIFVYGSIRVVQELDENIGKTGQVFLILAVTLKAASDCCLYYYFFKAFKFFVEKKRQTRKREALGLSPLNKLIIFSISVMFTMRILGSLFNFQLGFATLFDFYFDPTYLNFRVVMINIVFPLREFTEVLFFSYLFFS